MVDNPLMNILVFLLSLYLLKIFFEDLRDWKKGDPNPKGLPGATTAPKQAYVIAIVGALVLLGAQVVGELALGLKEEQSVLPWIALFALLAAGIIEEVIFRGFLVITSKGKAGIIASAVGFSLLFAVLHPHLWQPIEEPGEDATEEEIAEYEAIEPDFEIPYLEGTWHFDEVGAWFTTIMLFANSVFWYWLRFMKANPNRSILPCMVSHAVMNLGVFLIKLFTGYVSGVF